MKQQSIKKNFIYSTMYQILQVLSPLITAPYVSRVLGADGIGVYSYTSSLVSYFVMFAALGVLSYGNREIAQQRDDTELTSKIFWEIEIVVVVMSLISLGLWIVFSFFYSQYTVYLLILSTQIIGVIFDISWFFSGLELYNYIAIKNSICKIISIILIFVFVKSASDTWIYVLIMSAAILVGNMSMWTNLKTYLVPVSVKTFTFKKHIREMLVYFLPTIATSVYTVMDKSLIGLITNSESQNGYYDQATKIINIAKSVTFVSINNVMGSRTSYLFRQKAYEEIRERIEETFNLIFIIGFAISFGISTCAYWLVPWFFGPGYEPVVWLLILLTPVVLIIGISNCAGTLYYTPAGYRAKSTKYIVTGSVVNLIMNILLIPHFGAYGAAVGTVVAESVITLLYVYHSDGFVKWHQIISLSSKRCLAGAIMCAVIVAVSWNRTPSIVLTICQVIIGGIVYVSLLWLMNDQFLKKYTLAFLRKMRIIH